MKDVYLAKTSSQNIQNNIYTTQFFIMGAHSSQVKQTVHAADHSPPPCSAKVKNGWRCTSSPSYAIMECRWSTSPSPFYLHLKTEEHTCRANSLVGDRIRALAPLFATLVLSFSKSGIKKHAVLPLPVLAIATTSRPSRTKGIV